MEAIVLIIDAVLLTALIVLIISARRFNRKVQDKPFKTNIIIESALSLEL